MTTLSQGKSRVVASGKPSEAGPWRDRPKVNQVDLQPDPLHILFHPRKELGDEAIILASKLRSHAELSPNGCIEWSGSRLAKGYGVFKYRKPKLGSRCWRVHRASYLLFIGDITSPMVCHSCDNPRCFNPRHLFLGDASSNRIDSLLKGRSTNNLRARRGERSNFHKLSEKQVLEIYTSALNNRVLSEKFGVNPTHIDDIKRGLHWRWLTNATIQKRPPKKIISIEAFGKTMTITQWAKETGIPIQTIHSRLRNGKTGNELLAPRYSD